MPTLTKAPSRKSLLATLFAALLAVTSVAVTPAKASPGDADIARTVLGIIALGAVVNALQNDRDRSRREPSRQPGRWDDPPRHWNDPPRGNAYGHAKRPLPSQCLFDVRTRDGWSAVYGRRCLEQVGVRVDRLPRDCAFEVRTDNGRRTVYGQRCLVRAGYRVEARRY